MLPEVSKANEFYHLLCQLCVVSVVTECIFFHFYTNCSNFLSYRPSLSSSQLYPLVLEMCTYQPGDTEWTRINYANEISLNTSSWNITEECVLILFEHDRMAWNFLPWTDYLEPVSKCQPARAPEESQFPSQPIQLNYGINGSRSI